MSLSSSGRHRQYYVSYLKLWTSRYLKKLPQSDWSKYRYAVCEHCRRYQRVLEDSEKSLDNCDACHQPLEGRNQRPFLIPEFGFIISSEPPATPGEEQPSKTYSTRTYFSGESDKEMAIINHAGYQGYKICHQCGYARLGGEKTENPHKTPWKADCRGKLRRYYLGHEYMTDILHVHFSGYANAENQFWISLLYALLEGASEALDVERQDLDGCLYPYAGDLTRSALILFDDVPGGAGHVRRIAQDEATVKQVLQSTYQRMKGCKCGGEEADASCYACLRNNRNQFCHAELNRGMVLRFLEQYCNAKS